MAPKVKEINKFIYLCAATLCCKRVNVAWTLPTDDCALVFIFIFIYFLFAFFIFRFNER